MNDITAEAAQNIITKVGLQAAVTAKASGIKISLVRMCLSDYLITSDEVQEVANWTQLKGNIVFDTANYITIDNNLLRAQKTTDAEEDSCVVVTLHLGYSYGDFLCGSAGVYLEDGTLFAVLKLPQTFWKYKKYGSNPGNSIKIPLGITVTKGDIIDISVIEAEYASIPEVTFYTDLPDANTSEHSMYIVYNYTGDGTPAIAARIDGPNTKFWSFTLLAKEGWTKEFIQEDSSRIPYDDRTVLEFSGDTETWSKASGDILLNEVNPYIGTSIIDLTKETFDYNTQIYNKPKIRNSLNQEIVIQNTISTDAFNLVDKNDVETSDASLISDSKVFSASVIQNIRSNLEELIKGHSLDNLTVTSPLSFDKSIRQLSVQVDTQLSPYSNNPVQNQAIYNELSQYIKNDELATVAFTGNYYDLNNIPEIRGNVVQHVTDFPTDPDNFLYEKLSDIYTFIGTYNLTSEAYSIGYLVTDDGLTQNGTVICPWSSLPSNWTEGENYSTLFVIGTGRSGDVMIYEKDGVQYFTNKYESDPELMRRQLYYITNINNVDSYEEIVLKRNYDDTLRVAKTVLKLIDNATYTSVPLTIQESGATYEMSASGILYIEATNSSTLLDDIRYVILENLSGTTTPAYGNSVVSSLIAQVSVRKGDKVVVTYNTTIDEITTFKLVSLDYNFNSIARSSNYTEDEAAVIKTVLDLIENAKYVFTPMTLDVTGTVYTAPQSGLLYLKKKNSAKTVQEACFVSVQSASGLSAKIVGNTTVPDLVFQLSVRKGEGFEVEYNTTGETVIFGVYSLNYDLTSLN